ncbi:unnamed protein product [Clonostachys chloroleuca]|uniref:Uncharacterized protein n=1 Tax=Clonostachys chloroleuca TaxID=1926264 RepID=A0AA35Q5L9_9HYPO|nr:unnamed protein product [Clonostachys chloroleuca]
MAADRPRHDDTGPFASLTQELSYGGSGPQEHNFRMHDTDVVLMVEGASHNLHLLHLQNVRADTVSATKAAVDDFLGHLEPTAQNKRVEKTVFQNFSKIHQELSRYVASAQAEVEDLRDQLEWVDDTFPRRDAPESPAATQLDFSDNNPVAAVHAACQEFLKQLELIKDPGEDIKQSSKEKNTKPEKRKRAAHTMSEGSDQYHQEVCTYMEEQAEGRGLIFKWSDGSYPRDSFRRSGSRIRYDVYFREGGDWSTHYGSC